MKPVGGIFKIANFLAKVCLFLALIDIAKALFSGDFSRLFSVILTFVFLVLTLKVMNFTTDSLRSAIRDNFS